MAFSHLPRPLRLALALGGVLVLLALVLPGVIAPLLAGSLRAEARGRGLEPHWRKLEFRWPLDVTITGLEVRREGEPDTLASAERVELAVRPRGWSLRPRVTRLALDQAQLRLRAGADGADDDHDVPAEAGKGPAAPRVRAAAQQLADALLLPARRLPELRLTGVSVWRGRTRWAALQSLTLTHRSGGVQLAAVGEFTSEERIPFDVALDWRHDDHLSARADFRVPEAGRHVPLGFVVDGRVTQDRRHGVLRVAEGTQLTAGRMNATLSGEVRRKGPRFAFALTMTGLTARGVQRSLPRAVLGPLSDLPVSGAWEWRASLDVNVAAPESTRFTADVIPHGLALAGSDATLRLGRLSEPFLAEIHVHDRIVYRELSSANPHYRPLERVSPLLQHAVLTNEDGSFFRHRGFNTEAIQLAMADNMRAGTFKRGAGTVTMQLARNLFLGHRRTLSRKGQEVVLAWILEHLTGLSKDRLLEIYLNIIEWGPDVHGADEAAQFYFAKDAADVTLDEALFLAIVVPSPSRWRTRFDAQGQLRPWARAQMAYIARKMSTREWLRPEDVPSAEQLSITLKGPAAAVFLPQDSAAVHL